MQSKAVDIHSPLHLIVGWYLLHQLKLTGLPSLVKPRLQRPVQAQEDIPTFVGNSLYPVGLMALRCGGAKPDIYRGVRVHDDTLCLATDAGELFISLQHRAGLIVIDDEWPEILCRNV